MFGCNGKPDGRQRPGGAIGADAGIDADAHFDTRRDFDFHDRSNWFGYTRKRSARRAMRE